ncbi:MAG: cellulase family glycosylhydrolase, partial [Armatimonadetes bacterium]|nr:cellulase family glycosylhydrolase [Armatimonadota bacterium]
MTWLCLAATALAAATLSTDHFANVLVGAEPLRVTVVGGGAVELRNLAGDCLERREAGDGAVDFGPRPPGYYEVVAGETRLPVVVLVDPARRVPGDSRLATDNAMSWLVKPEQHAAMARLLRQVGVSWVRERLSWGEVQPQPETWQWKGRTDSATDALAAEGLRVFNVFHGVPGWSRADRNSKAPPDDLRVIHRFARTLAEHYAGKTAAWEVWNEPDISFFARTADECAAFQKAAFLGFRAVDPELLVLGPSMAHGVAPFAEHLLANGLAHYADRWNYHIYAEPSQYAARHRGFVDLLRAHGAALPSWVTEAGDRVMGPEGLLGDEARR